jgi:hypothetical protein
VEGDAMSEVLEAPMSAEGRADLRYSLLARAAKCHALIMSDPDMSLADISRLQGKASAYEHAAQLVEREP